MGTTPARRAAIACFVSIPLGNVQRWGRIRCVTGAGQNKKQSADTGLEALRTALIPYYLHVQFLHLLSVAIWSFSTTVAFRNFIIPAFRAWQRDPHNPVCIARRNEFMERFDKGVILEHIAFPVLVITGLMLVWLAGWQWRELNWLTIKLVIIAIVFIPVEIADYYLSHLGGNKKKIRAAGNSERYEVMVMCHWRFLKMTTPLVVFLVPLLFYLAVTKPF